MQLVGHQATMRSINHLLKNGHLPHAVIFSGKESIGKSLFAKQLAFTLLTGQPALTNIVDIDHPDWQRIIKDWHPDFLNLSQDNLILNEGRLEFKADDVHRVKDFFNAHRAIAPWRVVIIDSIAQVSIRSANTLLKIIEEPPPFTLIIIIAHNLEDIIPTIRSRCQIIAFGDLSLDEMHVILNQQDHQISHLSQLMKINCLGGSVKNIMMLGQHSDAEFVENLSKALKAIQVRQPHHYINLWDSFGGESGLTNNSQKYNFAFEILMNWVASLYIHQDRPLPTFGQTHKNIIDYWFKAHQQWSQAQIYHLDKKITLTIIVNQFAQLLISNIPNAVGK